MRKRAHVFAAVAAACLLTGCGGKSTSVAIVQPPPAPFPQTTHRTQADDPTPLAPPGGAAAGTVAAATAPPHTQGSPEASATSGAPAQHPESSFEERQAPAAIDTFLDQAVTDPPAARPETEQAVVTDLEHSDSDLPIPLNDRVLSYVELFSGRLKWYIEDGLNRGGRYLPMVRDIFEAEGLPLDLSYVPLIESAFKPSALSRAQARGIWQFMRGTAIENGLQHDWYIDERADPEKATRAAAKYLKFLHDKFGDWHLALAAYNGGWGRVQRAMQRSGESDFWGVSQSSRFLPRETRDYVPLILAAVIVARNPAQYGLALEPMVEVPSEVVAVATPTDLRRLADWTGTSMDVLQDLNPELRRWTTPARGGDYPLRVPLGTAEIVRERTLAVAAGDDLLDPFATYEVKRGETIAGIAKKLGVLRADLADANYLSARTPLQAGQRLIIPRPPSTRDSLDATLARNTAASEPDPRPAVVRTVARVAPRAPEPSRATYRVKSGDTLTSIARVYRMNVASLRDMNHLRDDVIKIGQRLTVPGRSGAVAD